MSKYPDVKENDTLTFSADRYNAVNRLLDNAEKLVPHHNEPVPYQREARFLCICHAGTLKAGDAAEITGIWDNPARRR